MGTAIWEEVTFRGLLFRVTENTFGTWVGVAVSAIAFGALHGLNPNASLAASVAIILESGILLAAAYFATRTSWLPIGLHFGWNFAEDFIFGVRISGHAARPAIVEGTLTGSPLWTGGTYGPGIFDFGDRNGGDLVRRPHHDRHSSTRNRAIHA
jgi:membrane protease YdiL (CAAX protease family)